MYQTDMEEHPSGKCAGKRCSWCFPAPGRVRVQVVVRLDLDIAGVCREMGITDMNRDDPKRWLEEDLSVLISKLPYLHHVSKVSITAKGLRRDGR